MTVITASNQSNFVSVTRPSPVGMGLVVANPEPRPQKDHARAGTGRLRNGNAPGDLRCAPRCGARTRAGHGCRQPAMRNGRCRLHGGKSTGPRALEGLERSRRAGWHHGGRSRAFATLRHEGVVHRRRIASLCRALETWMALKVRRAPRPEHSPAGPRPDGTEAFPGRRPVPPLLGSEPQAAEFGQAPRAPWSDPSPFLDTSGCAVKSSPENLQSIAHKLEHRPCHGGGNVETGSGIVLEPGH